MRRVEVDERGAGDLFVLAGFPEVEIGDTFASPIAPEPLPRPQVVDVAIDPDPDLGEQRGEDQARESE